MARRAGPKLVDVHCPKCQRFLAAVPAGTNVRCPKCNKWERAKDVLRDD